MDCRLARRGHARAQSLAGGRVRGGEGGRVGWICGVRSGSMPGEFRTYRRGAGAPRPRSGRQVALGLPGRFAEEAEKGMPDWLGRPGRLLSPGVRSRAWTGVLDDEPETHDRRSLIANEPS